MKRFMLTMIAVLMLAGCFVKGNVKVTDDQGNQIIEVETHEIKVEDLK